MLKLKNPNLLRHHNFINGQWLSSDETIEVFNPANGNLVAAIADGTPEDARNAVNAAHTAFHSWSRMSPKERAVLLRRWYELIMTHADDLGAIMTAEQGKPLAEAIGEVKYGAAFVEYYAEEAKRVMGDTIPTDSYDRRMQTLKQPVGVVGCITPWNFPSAMITRKVGPAIAAGCTVVIKPAAETPLSALALCALAEQAEIPKGVINVVAGSNSHEIGRVLTQDSKVAKFAFTGSTAVGRTLMAQCATTVKKVSLELGGNAPFIVFNDADLDQAVAGCIATKFRNSGQTCVCTNRIYAQKEIADEFTVRLKEAIAALKVGDGFIENNNIGPLITPAAVENIEALISDAKEKGAKVLLGGEQHLHGANFFQPTLLINITSEMRLAHEEIFGPIAAIQTFETEAEVIERANDTEYGLAAYFFSRDIGRVIRVSEQLDSGIVCSNSGVFSTEMAPFGGWKQSGIGYEGGKEGISEFYETKFHSIGGIDS